jgi:gliding motility-associated-like protein
MITANSGKYTLTVGGCSNVSVSKIVSVENSPSFTGNTEVCVGDTLNLMSDFTAGGTYLWTRPNGYTSSSQNLLLPSINFIDAGTYSLSVGGCPNTLNIFVNVLSNPTFSGDTTICEGDPLYLSSISNPGKTYLWTGPNGFISTSQDLIIPAINSTNVGKYTFRMSGCPNEISTIVTTLNRPLITGDTTLCVGDPLNLISVASPDNSYLWTGPNGYTSTSQNLEIPLTNLNHAGKYTLTLSGCATAIADKIVKVVSSPIVNLGNDTIICGGISLKLDAENTDCDFQWNTGANSQSIFIYLPGIYSVKVSNGWCSTIDEILIEECGTDLWFPNVYTPNNDGKNDRFNPVFQGKLNSYKILIFNRWGQQIYESMDAYTGWDGTFEGSQCPDGVYYFLAQYATGTGTSALKQRVKRGSVTILR